MKLFLAFFFLFLISVQTEAQINVTDDEGYKHSFDQPVKKIISLSPHSTELLFSAGATNQVIATVSFSDYPEQARKIPRIGTYRKIDMEKIIELQPDLIIGWKGGGALEQDRAITQLGFPIYYSEPKSFIDVAQNIMQMGKMLGTSSIANKTAKEFLYQLEQLKTQYKNRSVLNVFYQVWNEPLMTINRDHLITEVINFCGGHNVFGNLKARAPRVSMESVIARDPDVIIIGLSDNRHNWSEAWRKWQLIRAVKNNHVFTVNADYIVRQGVRVLHGIKTVCEHLDEVRMFHTTNNNK